MKIEFHVIKLLKVELISWKIYMIIEFCFNIEKFKEQTKIDKYSNLMPIWLSLLLWNSTNPSTQWIKLLNHHLIPSNLVAM